MNLSAEIISVLDALCEKFGIAVDWTQENILPYAEQLCKRLISYEIATSIYWIGFAAVIALLGAFVCFRISRYSRRTHDTGIIPLMWFIGYICVLAVLFILAMQAYDIITAYVFPESVIINQLRMFVAGLQVN